MTLNVSLKKKPVENQYHIQSQIYMFDRFVYNFVNLISCAKEVGAKNYVCRTVAAVKFAQHQQNRSLVRSHFQPEIKTDTHNMYI